MSDFQTQVNALQAPAVEGDFASTNYRHSVLAGPGGLVAGSNGVTVGRFAWIVDTSVDADGAPATVNSFGVGAPAGIVHRAQQGLITVFLDGSSMVVPEGFPVTLFNQGDFWVKNLGATQALPGQKAYASFADGSISFAASGAASTASGTGTIAAETFSATGSITGNVLTVTAVGSGTLYPGAAISGTNVASGSTIVSQLTGAAGGVGTYAVSIPEQAVASTTISGTYGLMTVSAMTTGAYGVGQSITGAGVVADTYITALGTGAGGTGTYIVNNTQTVASEALTGSTNFETNFYARSAGLNGELVKISSAPMAG